MRIRLEPAAAGDLGRPAPALARGIEQGFPDGDGAMLADVLATIEAQPRPAPWGSYWACCEPLDVTAGLCGFKAAPDAQRAVEIAYFTFPGFEGRGVATGMARGLVEIAAAHGASAVLAHTLPERNASGSVLTRLGFAFEGSVDDPEDGTVWRWVLPISRQKRRGRGEEAVPPDRRRGRRGRG